MTKPIEWGPPIAVKGKRPEWLKDEQVVCFENRPGEWLGEKGNFRAEEYVFGEPREDFVGCPISIRLPVDHPHYQEQEPPLCERTPPEWALGRAIDLSGVEAKDQEWQKLLTAFARFIAEHEEPPVDRDLIEARKLASEMMLASKNRFLTGLPERVASGEKDGDLTVQIPLAAIKLGRRLAEEGK